MKNNLNPNNLNPLEYNLWTGNKLPECIDSKGHWFKTCNTCGHTICKRCSCRTVNMDWLFCNDVYYPIVPYDLYCYKCEMLTRKACNQFEVTYKSYDEYLLYKKQYSLYQVSENNNGYIRTIWDTLRKLFNL